MDWESELKRFGQNAGFVRELVELYRSDPNLIEPGWRSVIESLVNGRGTSVATADVSGTPATESDLVARTLRLVNAHRSRGHLKARISPLETTQTRRPQPADLDIERYHFTAEDLNQVVPCAGFRGRSSMKLADLLQELDQIYCGGIGLEINHLRTEAERLWLFSRFEARFDSVNRFSSTARLLILKKLIDARSFEGELHRKYIGHKRFSLEGGESVIPMLEILLSHGAAKGVRAAVMGMSHRGRLNVLANIVGKPLEEILSEFEDTHLPAALGAGDVKYHLGYRSSFRPSLVSDGDLELHLAPNPSHLEFVNPVVQGMSRALQDHQFGGSRERVLPVLLHGDAAFAGQGIVYETLSFSGLPAHTTGGTIHIIVNNQIGFTTSPEEGRSSTYCSDVAHVVRAPVIHVNGDEPEECCWAIKTAFDFRREYQRDVVIDLYCYRRYGHNEGDDPSFTQPEMYREIKKKPSLVDSYAEHLISEQVINAAQYEDLTKSFRERFELAHRNQRVNVVGEACSMTGKLRVPSPDTSVSSADADQVAAAMLNTPADFSPHPKVRKIIERRVESLRTGEGIDWGSAEALALGTLVLEGVSVRLVGQDSQRGTFSQRHLVLADHETGERYSPLAELAKGGTCCEIYNSILSEAGVLGFEFGYSSLATSALVMWEAQFGDFGNSAQVIIDQFISTSEAKWNQLSGVVLLLPHGFEGQGPEHSSARLERFLALCAEGNMLVCYPSNAAQYFHLLRRQGLTTIKRPLVVMTPKSLLRLPEASCSRSALEEGSFQSVIAERFGPSDGVPKVVFLSGKVYYDVRAGLPEDPTHPILLVRIEQLYPFPQYELRRVLKDTGATECIWVQEEPQNMGAWTFCSSFLPRLDIVPQYVGRAISATPATGSPRRHQQEQEEIVAAVQEFVR